MTDYIEKKCKIKILEKGFAELTDIVKPYIDDFTGYNEETNKFDIVLCVKELLQQLQAEKEKVKELEEWKEANKPTGICETCTEINGQLADKYKLALEEIKRIGTGCLQSDINGTVTLGKQILQKCEVLNDV